jgi:integrase
MKRNRRAGVEDRWTKTVRDEHGNTKTVPSANDGKGKRWRARYVDDQGHERAKAFTRKADAQAWLDSEVTAKLATGTYVAPKAGMITVETVFNSWSAGQAHISPKTAEDRRVMWRNHVRPQWGSVNVVDVKTSAVKAWVAKMLADGVGVPTVTHSFGLLRQILGAAVEDCRIPRNPCEGVKLPKRQHTNRGYLSHVQVAALAAAVDRHPEVIRFLAYTGLRWGEMAALRVQDFDMLRRRVNVSRSVSYCGTLVFNTPKSGERRSVPFPASLADELGALMVGKRSRPARVHQCARRGVAGHELPDADIRTRGAELSEGRRDIPAHHSPFPSPHGGQFGGQRWGQREGRSADAWARQGLDDAGRLRRPVRRRSGRGGRPVGHGDQIYCGLSADWVG